MTGSGERLLRAYKCLVSYASPRYRTTHQVVLYLSTYDHRFVKIRGKRFVSIPCRTIYKRRDRLAGLEPQKLIHITSAEVRWEINVTE